MRLSKCNGPIRLDSTQSRSKSFNHPHPHTTSNSLMRRTDDPAAEPYRSQYEARRRLLATTPPTTSTTTAPSPALATARRAFRLGRIAFDTEQPSAEAEQMLRQACEAYFPGLYDAAAAIAAEAGKAGGGGSDEEKAPVRMSKALAQVRRVFGFWL